MAMRRRASAFTWRTRCHRQSRTSATMRSAPIARSVTVEETRPEVGLPPVTADTRAPAPTGASYRLSPGSWPEFALPITSCPWDSQFAGPVCCRKASSGRCRDLAGAGCLPGPAYLRDCPYFGAFSAVWLSSSQVSGHLAVPAEGSSTVGRTRPNFAATLRRFGSGRAAVLILWSVFDADLADGDVVQRVGVGVL